MLGCNRIDDDTRRRQLSHRRAGDEALGVLGESSIKGELLDLCHLLVTPGEHLLWGVAGEPGVMMVEVVPVEV